MCLLSVPVSIVPRDTCVSENGRLIAALGDTEIIITEWDFKMVSKPVTSKHYGLHDTATYNRQIIFVDESTVCVLGDASNALSTLSVLTVNTGTVTHVIKAPGLVAVIAPIPGQRRVICQSHDGSIFTLDIDLETIDLRFKLPGFCPAISGRIVDGQVSKPYCAWSQYTNRKANST